VTNNRKRGRNAMHFAFSKGCKGLICPIAIQSGQGLNKFEP